MNGESRPNRPLLYSAATVAFAVAFSAGLSAQTTVTLPSPAAAGPAPAKEIVRGAVLSELQASKADKSLWRYKDESDAPGKTETFNQIETPQGELRRLIALNGRPLTPEEDRKEMERISRFVTDSSAQAKARKDGEHDDAQAERFLRMLPDAFTWSVVKQGGEETTLHYVPNPAFKPPTIEARVLAAMEGEMVVAKDGDRIKTLRGKLTHDVKIGGGLLGKMDQGGTFNVERRAVEPGHWEITENHVHINGHALLFKTISQNADEVKTMWAPSTAKDLGDGARQLGVK
jgi:hypothetical protein